MTDTAAQERPRTREQREQDADPESIDQVAEDAINSACEAVVGAFRPLLEALWRGGLAVGRVTAADPAHEVMIEQLRRQRDGLLEMAQELIERIDVTEASTYLRRIADVITATPADGQPISTEGGPRP